MTTSIVIPTTSDESFPVSRVRVLPGDRVAPLRKPQVRKPDWNAIGQRGNSNTYRYSSAPVARPVSGARRERISGANEKTFESRIDRKYKFYARVERVIHSPGATVLSLGAMSAVLGLAPILMP